MEPTNTTVAILAFSFGICAAMLLVAASASHRIVLRRRLASEREKYRTVPKALERKTSGSGFAEPEIQQPFLPLDFVTLQTSDERRRYYEAEGIVLEACPHSTYRIIVNGHEMTMPGIFLTPMARKCRNKGRAGETGQETKPNS